jgi:acetoin utilization deacetylase AcuC-like enzyme
MQPGGDKMKTGVFFHEAFKGKDWDIIGDRFREFPRVMEKALAHDGVMLFEPEEAEDQALLKVHTREYLNYVRKSWYYRGAALTVGGCIAAAEKIAAGELTNALVFSVAAGHHAGPSSGWGGTYLSCAGPAVAHVREMFGVNRFAILDTDAHHGDGTREIFRDDSEVLHVCFCSYNGEDASGTKVDVDVDYRIGDLAYLEKVSGTFFTRLREFNPFMIFHNLGHDTCQGDYGDRGLTRSFYPRLAQEVKQVADEVCRGRYLIITHGGFRVDVSEYIWPRIIEVLAD